MGLTGSNSGLFRALAFIVSPVGKGEKNRKKGRKEKGIERKGKEGRWGKKRSEGRKEEGILTIFKIKK